MAKNYSIAEATKVIAEGTDLEALQDLGRRFPVLSIKLAKLTEKAGEEVNDLFQYLPEHLSANKVNQAIKASFAGNGAGEDADGDADEEAEAKPVKPAKVAGKKDGSRDYAAMSSGDLWKLLGECGARKACEKEFGSCKKEAAVAYFEKYGEAVPDAGEEAEEEKPAKPAKAKKAEKPAKPAKKVMPEPEEEEEDAEEAEEQDYSKMNAMELFKVCKAKGIKAEMKKPAKYYRDLLAKAEAEAEEAEDEDWEDDAEEAEEEEPVKPAKKAPAKAKAEKPAKKAPAKKAEAEEEEEDEDWDI